MDDKGWASSAGGGVHGMRHRGALAARMKEIEALRPLVKRLPDVREHLVAVLREEIRSGRYRVDPRRVAERIMEEAL